MALVKTNKLKPGGAKKPALNVPIQQAPKVKARPAKISPTGSRQEKASERMAAATEQLASALTESAAAAEELRRAMEQIAAGAAEASSGSHEQMTAVKGTVSNLGTARGEAENSQRKAQTVQASIGEASIQISTSVRAIERNAERQRNSVLVIVELEKRAKDIGEIADAVGRISEQTNLLALNAAIEAARAGDHGRGFAVVAEEVSAMAEVSERSSKDVQGLSGDIQDKVQKIVAAVMASAEAVIAEAKTGNSVVEVLEVMRGDMSRILNGSQEISIAAAEAERAALEVQRGAEQVSSAAEEQASAASMAQSAIKEQARALDQAQIAAGSLAQQAEKLRSGAARGDSAAQIAAMAEELSATVQEMSGTASEIMATVSQIDRGAQQQAAATQQTAAALTQIEKSAKLAQSNAKEAQQHVQQMGTSLKGSRDSIEKLVTGVANALSEARSSLVLIADLETVARRIEKNVDGISIVAVQTSMLAVSGAVEAARAGDSGRGFAVVSNDIRGLAREAAESADRVKDTVRGVIDQVRSVRGDIEQIIAAAETEVEKNRSIAGLFDRAQIDVAALHDLNGVIVQGTDAILISSSEAAAGAQQIASAAEEAGVASRQAASAASEQASGAEDLAAAIEEIASLAEELNKSNV